MQGMPQVEGISCTGVMTKPFGPLSSMACQKSVASPERST